MTAAILLAAGASRRMGRPKLELRLGGLTVLQRSLECLLASRVDPVVMVVSPGGEKLSAFRSQSGVRVVVNPRAYEGMASSIRAGVAALPDQAEAVLIALADKPLVQPATVRAVVSRFEQTGAPVVYPTYRKGQGHPVLIARALFGELLGLSGDSGAKGVIRKHAAAAVAVEVDDPGVLLDIDTAEDYAKLLQIDGGSKDKPS
ncbi:MAG: NTP transferase domain-containing protein, partial [Acidobacteriota bacterium]